MSLTVNYTGSNNEIHSVGSDSQKKPENTKINDAAQQSFKQIADSRQGGDCHPICCPCYVIVGLLRLIACLFKCCFPCLKAAAHDSRHPNHSAVELSTSRNKV